jgi:hypothetical protein
MGQILPNQVMILAVIDRLVHKRGPGRPRIRRLLAAEGASVYADHFTRCISRKCIGRFGKHRWADGRARAATQSYGFMGYAIKAKAELTLLLNAAGFAILPFSSARGLTQ